jgi:hypothetical protein
VVLIAGVLLLAVLVVPAPWGFVAVTGAIASEILEKVFWFYRTKDRSATRSSSRPSSA